MSNNDASSSSSDVAALPIMESTIGTEDDSKIPLRLCYRETHTDWLKTFLLQHIENGKSGLAYLKGPTGTGKSTSIFCVLLVPKIRNHYQKIEVDCTKLADYNNMFKVICELLHLEPSKEEYYQELKRYFSTKPKTLLLVLEQLDSLGIARNEMVYRLLTLGGLVIVATGSSPLLITTLKTHLPLHTLMSLKFPPYKKEQILDILGNKLTLDPKVMFETSALDMLAEKVSMSSGDMREAVNMMWLVGKLVRLANGYSIVYLADVHNMFHQLRGPWILDLNEDLTLHERVILCSIIMILPRQRRETLALNRVFDIYEGITSTHGIPTLNMTEVWTFCKNLSSRKVLRAIPLNNRTLPDWHIRLFGDRKQIEEDLKKSPLFGLIIEQADSFFA